MSTDAETHGTNFAGTFRMRSQIAQCSLGIGIVAGEFFVDFVRVPPIRARLIVWKHSAWFFEFMKYFRNNDNESVSGQQSCTTPNRSGDLKDFGEQDDPWITAFSDRIQKVGAHWPGWRWDIDEFVISDDHKLLNGIVPGQPRQNERAKLIAQSLDNAIPIREAAR